MPYLAEKAHINYDISLEVCTYYYLMVICSFILSIMQIKTSDSNYHFHYNDKVNFENRFQLNPRTMMSLPLSQRATSSICKEFKYSLSRHGFRITTLLRYKFDLIIYNIIFQILDDNTTVGTPHHQWMQLETG